MLLRTQVHGVGEVVADVNRHPDIGLARTQSLGMVVLCPQSLIDSSHLVAFIQLAGKAWQDQDGMRHSQAQGALFKNPVEKGVVNSKLLPVTSAGMLRRHNKDRSSYY